MTRCSLDMFFFFKQKTAYEMRISDWSSDVCSSDLTCNFFVAELAKSHRGDVERVQHLLAMNQRDGCQEAYFATRTGAQLGMRPFDIAGLAENLLVQRSRLIGAGEPAGQMAVAQRSGIGERRAPDLSGDEIGRAHV